MMNASFNFLRRQSSFSFVPDPRSATSLERNELSVHVKYFSINAYQKDQFNISPEAIIAKIEQT